VHRPTTLKGARLFSAHIVCQCARHWIKAQKCYTFPASQNSRSKQYSNCTVWFVHGNNVAGQMGIRWIYNEWAHIYVNQSWLLYKLFEDHVLCPHWRQSVMVKACYCGRFVVCPLPVGIVFLGRKIATPWTVLITMWSENGPETGPHFPSFWKA
jgi:hypothetical protein